MNGLDRVKQVQAAMDASQQALDAGDRVRARAWLSRACRLAPLHHAAKLALASLWLGEEDAEAERLFAHVLEHFDVREAWTGLAVARWRRGDCMGSTAALARAHSRHALSERTSSFADEVAGELGWCGLGADGSVTASVAARSERDGGWISVTSDGRHLLGSPIDIAAISRIEGCVAIVDGAIEGWAWHPADPARDPVLTWQSVGFPMEPSQQVTATALARRVHSETPLASPRSFTITARELAGFSGPVAIQGSDGRHLTGSPLDPGAVKHALPLAPACPSAARPAVDIVIPVYRGAPETLACIRSVLASRPHGARVIVVDDASPEPELVAALDRLASRKRITLVRHAANRGFPAAANAGLRAASGRDVVMLNSDTLVPPGWLARLRRAAYGTPDVGTATPLSNDATILSYPHAGGGNDVPDAIQVASLDGLAAWVNAGLTVEIPTAVGFCMYLRRDCLDQVGGFREDVFAQGYGEENDFCQRAAAMGWRHVAATDVFVGHLGGRSFGAARHHLLARNGAVLSALHPGYDALIAAFIAADPMAGARFRLDEARWRDASTSARAAVLLVTHAAGGGVERQVQARCATILAGGQRPVVLRPALFGDETAGVQVGDGFPNLRFRLPAELALLEKLLAASRPVRLELHHRLGHSENVLDIAVALDIPMEIHVHDYAAICPRMNLIGPDGRYCGEPEAGACASCIQAAGRNDGRHFPAPALRAESDRILARAASLVVPSADTAHRLRRHFPQIRPEIVPHEDDGLIPAPPAPALLPNGRCRVAVVGAIGIEKGFDVLLACARDAAARNLPLEFVVVGHTIDDARLFDTSRVFVTGEYAQSEAVSLIRAQHATLGWVASILPETWCFTLTEIWRAGLRAVAFDIGAPSERIRAVGQGMILPVNLPPGAVNDAFLLATGAGCERRLRKKA